MVQAALKMHPGFQFPARFEMRYLLIRYEDDLAGFRVSPRPACSFMDEEATETPDFGSVSLHHCCGDGIQDDVHYQFHILAHELRTTFSQSFHQFTFGHLCK